MNLSRAKQFLSRLPIRNLQGKIVPFRFNFNQLLALKKYQERMDQGRPLWVICLKSRRVGFSSMCEGLMFSHCVSTPNARALVVAHQFQSSKALFEVPLGLIAGLPFSIPAPTQSRIIFPHHGGDSFLSIATAGSISGGRGLTLSALLLSEGAYYKGQGSFTSLLPAVSFLDKHSMVFIESTANGKTGIGETFYEYWTSAVEERNEFIALFLSWLDDPGCRRHGNEALDAPQNDLERELMRKPYNADRSQIAWMRWCLETQCHGLIDVFAQEYPWDPDVAFVSSGDPAFSKDEMSYLRASIAQPMLTGRIEMRNETEAELKETRGGWNIYELPDGVSWYYIGADAARGVEHGDFAAAVVWNGHTGAMAASFNERIDPETFAVILNAAGKYYGSGRHCAMINVELTGNLGLWTQNRLRELYHYPNLYVWRGRDDRKRGSASRSSLGWDTSYRTREMMFAIFRSALAHHRVEPKDRIFIQQAEAAQRSQHIYDFEVKRGHDDVFMAGLLGWVAREQYPPPLRMAGRKKILGEEELEPLLSFQPDETFAGQMLASRHVASLRQREKWLARLERQDKLSELW